MTWFVYLIECVDGSLYTGIAVDVDARYAAHARGKGARYTRAHPPARLLARFAYADRSAASKAEYAIKQLSPAAKRALCANGVPPPPPAHAAQAAVQRGLPDSDGAACGVPRSPRPLEVVAAEMTADVHHLADEIQARHAPRLQRRR